MAYAVAKSAISDGSDTGLYVAEPCVSSSSCACAPILGGPVVVQVQGSSANHRDGDRQQTVPTAITRRRPMALYTTPR